ncbi:MAG: M64 family metallopeptidase [Pseudomonadota bacterium]
MRLLYVSWLLLAGAAQAQEAPRTLRVDYYHSGNAGSESFSLDRLVREPLPWPGNPAHRLDDVPRGKYLFEIVLQGESTPVFSRSFSSIYGEWEATGEARRINRTFHESVRFPEPDRPFSLSVLKRDANNRFREIWRVDLDPTDYMVYEESPAFADEVISIQDSGDPREKVDLLLLGDGYTAAEHDNFVARARALAETLFATPPFSERRADFNVWAIAPAARQSGISRPSGGIHRDSPIGTSYDAFRSERYVLTYDNQALRRIASSAPYDAIEILTNSTTYGGGGIYGLYSTAAANSEWADYLFIHEFAHHFAGLADEYYTSSVAYQAPDEIREPYEANVTALLDPAKLKWRHLVAPDTPLPTPWPKAEYEERSTAYQATRMALRARGAPEADVNTLFRENQSTVDALFENAPHSTAPGAFEGALYQAKGYYRSEMNCIMFTRTEHFCRVCAAAINTVIDELTGH